MVSCFHMSAREFKVTAHYIARNIDLNLFAQRVPYSLILKTRTHFLFVVDKEQWLFVYGFGVIVLVNLPKEFLKKLMTKKVQQCCASILPERYTEEYQIIEDSALPKESVEFDAAKLPVLTREKLEIISEVVAQSVAIDVFDGQVDAMLQEFSLLTTELEQKGRTSARTSQILKLIGKDYSILEFMITRLSLLDKPEITWQEAELETLFHGLRSMFELEDRFTNLDYKLRFIQSNSELMLETVRTRRDQFLEVTIIGLIVIEIGLFIYELFREDIEEAVFVFTFNCRQQFVT